MTTDAIAQALDLLVQPFDAPDVEWDSIVEAASLPRAREFDLVRAPRQRRVRSGRLLVAAAGACAGRRSQLSRSRAATGRR